jgi:hypothetical protein
VLEWTKIYYSLQLELNLFIFGAKTSQRKWTHNRNHYEAQYSSNSFGRSSTNFTLDTAIRARACTGKPVTAIASTLLIAYSQ